MKVSSKDVISVNNFSFSYPQTKKPAISSMNFTVKEGEFFCIVGANGAGKSTLCDSLVGLIPQYFLGTTKGQVLVNGQETTKQTVAELSLEIGLVFQNPFNQLSYTTSTVAEELAYGLGNHGIPRSEMLDRVATVAKKMRIESLLDRDPLTLSGGQIQRVAFGSTYILNPSILVLDECTTQLDPIGSEEIFTIIKQLNDEGVTVVMTDTETERLSMYADRILLLDNGLQMGVDKPQAIFAREDLEKLNISTPLNYQLTQELTKIGILDSPEFNQDIILEKIKEVENGYR